MRSKSLMEAVAMFPDSPRSQAAKDFLEKYLPVEFESFTPEMLPEARKTTFEEYRPSCESVMQETGATLEEREIGGVPVLCVIPASGGRK
ncbi:MAG: hypothetical protein AAF420_16605, partial [Pseudomonadota bacterium]